MEKTERQSDDPQLPRAHTQTYAGAQSTRTHGGKKRRVIQTIWQQMSIFVLFLHFFFFLLMLLMEKYILGETTK